MKYYEKVDIYIYIYLNYSVIHWVFHSYNNKIWKPVCDFLDLPIDNTEWSALADPNLNTASGWFFFGLNPEGLHIMTDNILANFH